MLSIGRGQKLWSRQVEIAQVEGSALGIVGQALALPGINALRIAALVLVSDVVVQLVMVGTSRNWYRPLAWVVVVITVIGKGGRT